MAIGFSNIGGFNNANQAAIFQQHVADQRKAQSWYTKIKNLGPIPQGGPTLKHGDVNRAVDIGGAKTAVIELPTNDVENPPVAPPWLAGQTPTNAKGLAVDLNGDGKIQAGVDGKLALDLDGNGIYDNKDVSDTLKMLQMFSGAKVDAGGGFNQGNQAEILFLQMKGKALDIDQNGVLSSWELTKAGGRAVVEGEGGQETRLLPGQPQPQYQPFPQYFPQPSVFGGFPPYGSPFNFGPPAFLGHFMHNFMSNFAWGF